MTTPTHHRPADTGGGPAQTGGGPLPDPARQAFALWGGLLVWLFSFVAVWGITEIDCYADVFSLRLLGLPSATFFAMVVIALSALTALGAAHVAAGQRADPSDTEDERPFIVRFGVPLNGLFFLGILAGALPFFLLRTCS